MLFFVICAAAPNSNNNDIDLQGAKLLRIYSAGVKEYILPDGSRAIVWPDGHVQRTLVDGSVINSWNAVGNGEISRIRRPDGTEESRFANGIEKIRRSDGTVSWKFPGGLLREERPDGSVWESAPATMDIVDPEVVRMSPWPRRVEPMDRVVLSGELLDGYSNPWASIILSGGGIREIPTQSFPIRGNSFSLPVIMSDGPGEYRIEIIAKGPQGNKVALNVSIWAGIAPPNAYEKPTLYRTIDPHEPAYQLEWEFFDMINRERKKRDIHPVVWDSETGQLARNMAKEMSSEEYFGHVSPKWGNIAKRAIKLYKWQTLIYGVPTTAGESGSPNRIADDIITSRSLGGAMLTLLESPAHRKILLYPFWTHAGVGISRLKKGDRRDAIIVIAMMQLNRPKSASRPPPETSPEEEEIYFGKPR